MWPSQKISRRSPEAAGADRGHEQEEAPCRWGARRAPRCPSCMGWSRTRACTAMATTRPPPRRAGRTPTPGTPPSCDGPRRLPRRRRRRPRRQRLRSLRDPPRLRPRQDEPPAGRPRPARVGHRRRRPGDRGRAGRQVRGLDLQRPRARADAALHRGRAAADPIPQRLRAPAHDALPRRPLGVHGRDARDRRGGRSRADRAGRDLHLRVRRPALRDAPLPLPRLARLPRTSPRASTGRSSSTRPRGARRPTRW